MQKSFTRSREQKTRREQAIAFSREAHSKVDRAYGATETHHPFASFLLLAASRETLSAPNATRSAS
jgi:hypothetical protein